MNQKIILATVNAKKDLYSVTADEFSAIAPNVQLGLLGAYIKSKNINVRIIDSEEERLSIDDLINLVKKEKPLLLGIVATGANPSSSTMVMAGIVDFFKKFNMTNSPVKTFIWGPHPTVLPERSLKETQASFIVRGEGYETIVNLFYALHRGQEINQIKGLSYIENQNGSIQYCHTPDAELIKNLDSLPMIDWQAMNPSKYRAHNWHCFGNLENRTPYAIIWTSFGCPFQCNYCCINNLFGRRIQRFRSIKNVIEEISLLVETYKVKNIKILDELFVVNPQRIEEFCDRLEEKRYSLNMWSYSRVDTISERLLKRLKTVGMNWISYGFETATPQMLDNIEKGCKRDVDAVIKMTQEAGISICADVMFGLPDDTIQTMEQTYEFLVRHNFEWVNMYPMFAYPGTKLYAESSEPESWKTYALYGADCIPMGTKHLSPRAVLKFRDEAFSRYFGRPEYLAMIEKKFGVSTREHIQRMIAIPLRRKLLEQQ